MKNNLILLSFVCVALTGCGTVTTSENSQLSTVSSVPSILPDIDESSVVSELNLSDSTAPSTGSLESQVLYESDQVIIHAEGIETDSESTYMEITIENLLDQDIIVSCSEAYINNYLISSSFNAEIPASDNLLTGIDFSNTDLNACAIDTIGEISFSLTGFDYENADILYETPLMHITTDQYGTFEQTICTDGDVLWESNDVTFILRGLTHDSEFNPVTAILIMNHSDKPIFADAETIGSYANSVFIDFGYMLNAGTQALVYIRGVDSNGVLLDSLDGVSYHFMLSDGETWDDIATSEDLTF